MFRVEQLPPVKMACVQSLLDRVANDDFWRRDRFVQIVRMIDWMDTYGVKQNDIAFVLDVSKALVSRYKKYHQSNPIECRPRSGPKSDLEQIYPQIQFFIDGRNSDKEAVTMGVLLGFIVDSLKVVVSRKAVWNFMNKHDFAYTPAQTRDALRVDIEVIDVVNYYDALERDLDGINACLVYNMDEMGAELFADRSKEVMVYVRQEQVPRRRSLFLGVPRTTRRCTLIACISLSGDTLKPTIISRTKTINSIVFENGFSMKKFRLFPTDNSFINGDVFSKWLREVFLRHVEKKRKFLRSKLGDFNDWAVLIMDGCSAHKVEEHREFLAANRIRVRLLVAHTSHLTQPLDLGIFARCKALMKSDQTYVINLHQLDEVILEDIEASRRRRRVRPERGRLLGEFVLQILKAFHEATSPMNVVSAFQQAGICSRSDRPDPYMVHHKAVVDRARARLVIEELELFVDNQPLQEQAHAQLGIDDLNLEIEREDARRMTNGQSMEIATGVTAGSTADGLGTTAGTANGASEAMVLGAVAGVPGVTFVSADTMCESLGVTACSMTGTRCATHPRADGAVVAGAVARAPDAVRGAVVGGAIGPSRTMVDATNIMINATPDVPRGATSVSDITYDSQRAIHALTVPFLASSVSPPFLPPVSIPRSTPHTHLPLRLPPSTVSSTATAAPVFEFLPAPFTGSHSSSAIGPFHPPN